MGLIDIIQSMLPGTGDDHAFICLNCGAEYQREFAECAECGKPYISSIAEETGE
jgi:predicted ATP-dependent serine protease